MLIESEPGAGEAPGLLLIICRASQRLDFVNPDALLPEQPSHQFAACPQFPVLFHGNPAAFQPGQEFFHLLPA